jgi:hypothetical protein
MIRGLSVQLGNKIGPSRRKPQRSPRLLRSPRRPAGNIDEHNRKTAATECVRERASVVHDLRDRMHKRERYNPLL